MLHVTKWLVWVIVYFTCVWSLPTKTCNNQEGDCNNQTSRHTGWTKADVCETSECHHEAKELLRSMDRSVDPCDNFYRFACGGWIKTNRGLYDRWSRGHEQTEIMSMQQKHLLEEPIYDVDINPVKAAKTMYKACMDSEQIEFVGLQPLVDLSNELGGWPLTLDSWDEDHFDLQSSLADFYRRMGWTPLIKTGIQQDDGYKKNVITIKEPSTDHEKPTFLGHEASHDKLETYRHYIAEVAFEIMGHRENSDRVWQESLQIVEFEIALNSISTGVSDENDTDADENDNDTMKDLQLKTDLHHLVNSHARFSWLRFFNQILSDVNVTIDEGEEVVIYNEQYLIDLVTLLDTTPRRVIANYLQWSLIKAASAWTTARMNDLSTRFNGTVRATSRASECFAMTKSRLNHAISYKYLLSLFGENAKHSFEDMERNMRSAFKNRLAKLEWMDEATRSAVREKADALATFIGYPDMYTNESALVDYYSEMNVSNQHFSNMLIWSSNDKYRSLLRLRRPFADTDDIWNPEMYPDVLNAQYLTSHNSLVIPAASLQPFYYNVADLQALNYGRAGYTLGHEMVHGFDNDGRHYDKHGDEVQTWTNSTGYIYSKKAQCFIDQYDKYRLPLLGEQAKINGTLSLGENIADNGGINTAYDAYQEHVTQNGPEPRLPGLEEYSPDQLFFLSFAESLCSFENMTKTTYPLTDVHPPIYIRVYGTLSNSEDFARTYNCKVDSPMNPKQKCIIW